jgi:hypothetical protein
LKRKVAPDTLTPNNSGGWGETRMRQLRIGDITIDAVIER